MSAAEQKRYFAAPEGIRAAGGNLVLTDAALNALPALGVGEGSPTSRGRGPRRPVRVRRRVQQDAADEDVCLEGTAGGSSRQAVEPTPLGYTPDIDYDKSPARLMPAWYVNSAKWDKGCKYVCSEAALGGNISGEAGPENAAALGQRPLGKGRVAIAGVMFPDPNFAPGGPADMRFGLASYALTFSAWQTFLNLVNYRRR